MKKKVLSGIMAGVFCLSSTALAGVSRSKADSLISLGNVSVNSVVAEKSTKQITDGDVISIRTKGKFIIESTSGKTKKDRIVLEFKQYF